jgi:opacity protein-like surface antigen
MKRHTGNWIALAAAVALTTPTAGAQASVKLGISGGGTFPIGNFGDLNETGYNFGAHVLLSSPFLPQDLKLDVQHNRMELKGSDARTLITSAALNLELNPGSALARVAPYLSLGIGGYFVKTELAGPTPGTTRYDDITKFGLNAGGGLRFALSGLNTFVEARYHRVRSRDFVSRSVTYVPVVLGVTF